MKKIIIGTILIIGLLAGGLFAYNKTVPKFDVKVNLADETELTLQGTGFKKKADEKEFKIKELFIYKNNSKLFKDQEFTDVTITAPSGYVMKLYNNDVLFDEITELYIDSGFNILLQPNSEVPKGDLHLKIIKIK